MGEDRWLSVAQCAELAGVKPASWRGMVARGQAPAPDDPDADRPAARRAPLWKQSTVVAWKVGHKTRQPKST